MAGTLTAVSAQAWARAAYESNWTPKGVNTEIAALAPPSKMRKVTKVTVASFLDDSDDEPYGYWKSYSVLYLCYTGRLLCHICAI